MESQNKNVVFRGSMHGYNKKDVNDYIIRLSRDYFEKEQMLRSELRKSEAAAKSAEDEKARIKKELDKAKDDTKQFAGQLDEATATIAKLSEENRCLADDVSELKIANTTLRMKLDELKGDDKAEEEKSDARSVSLSDSMSVDLFAGSSLADKPKKADGSAYALHTIIDRIKQSIKSATDSCSEEFSAAVNELRVSAGSATGTFKKAADMRADETAERVNNILSELISSSIDSEMDKIEKLISK